MDKLQLGIGWLRAEWAVRRAGGRAGRRPIVFGKRPRIAVDGDLEIGDSVVMRDGPTLDVKHGGRLSIGDRAFLNGGSRILATTNVRLGVGCKIAPDAIIRDTDTHEIAYGEPPRAAPITLGRNVWVGQRAIVLPGVTIGDNAVIAAAAVVTGDIPANVIAAGVPARVVRSLPTPPEGWIRA
ncbi:acyltransferase [Baekduia sp. Peel2402]|uniref:acyltransferase n=1 Tax=Baekduia sp. Peel2402 TaxID=3458296 RepID=UPI00403E7F07